MIANNTAMMTKTILRSIINKLSLWAIPAIWGLACNILPAQQSYPAIAGVVELREYVVEGLKIEEAVGPLARLVSSEFGADRSIMDIPRAVSLINETLLIDREIDTVQEALVFSPGAYAPARFGNMTAPNIRADVAETYNNGQRRGANIFGIQPGFNAFEAVDLVRGPGSAVYGPGFYSGGYVNYVTKRPRFDRARTQITVRLGTWTPGNESYLNALWRVDHNQPFGDNLALRFSYEGQDNETIFNRNGARSDHQDFFLALAWKPSDRLTIDLNAQFSWQAAPQTLGVNRPNQELIDNGTYFTGTAPDLGGAFIAPWFLTPTGTTKIKPEDTLLSDDDFSNANVGYVQVIATATLSDRLTLVNRTFVEHVNRRRYHEFEYIEYVEQFNFENRSEFHFSFDTLDRAHSIIAGFTLRYEERESYVNFFNEAFFNFDITTGPPNFSQRDIFSNTYFPGQTGPGGRPFFGAEQFSPESTHSRLWNTALFWQHEFIPAEHWQLHYGIRGDLFLADVTDPLPPPGAKAWNDQHSFSNYGFNISLLYKPDSNFSAYATFNRTNAVNGNVTGGGIMLFEGQIDKDDFENRSDLYEAGARFSLLENKLYLGFTAFRQERQRTEFRGGKSDILVSGVELDTVYQPKSEFYLHANLTFTEGHYRDSAPFQLGGRSLFNLYAAGTGPGGNGNGLGFEPFPGAFQAPAADWRIPGLSRWLFNAGASWRPERGLGLSLWGSAQSEQIGNLDAEYVIPAQFTLNGSISWKGEGWEAEIGIFNITDQTNWAHNGDTFMNNQIIFRELPLHLEAHWKFSF